MCYVMYNECTYVCMLYVFFCNFLRFFSFGFLFLSKSLKMNTQLSLPQTSTKIIINEIRAEKFDLLKILIFIPILMKLIDI